MCCLLFKQKGLSITLVAGVFVMLFNACSTQRYIIISEHELKKEVEKRRKVPMTRYVTLPFYYEEYLQKRPIPEADTLVYHMASLIKKMDYATIDQLMERVTAPTPRSKEILQFCQGLYHFFKGEYTIARDFFGTYAFYT